MKIKKYSLSLILVFLASLGLVSAGTNNVLKSTDLQIETPKIQQKITPKYVIFTNMDAISDSAYYLPILDMPEYKDDFISLSFSNPTFQNYKITDFDLAIFPIGDNALNTATDSKATNVIISKIKEMIDSGKKVIVFSRRALWWAFNTSPDADAGKDPSTILYLTNTLGIQYAGTIPIAVTVGLNTTYSGYIAKGTPKDPIGAGDNKPSNIKVGLEPPIYEPLRYYTTIDIFKSVDNTKFVDIDHYIGGTSGPMGDTLLGMRTQIGKSRLVFTSYGLENIAEAFRRTGFLKRAIAWCLEAAPQPGAQIEKQESELQYGNIIINESQIQTAEFKSTGEQDLVVDSIYIDDSLFDQGGFLITDKPSLPLTVKPGDSFTVSVQFKPTDKSNYYALLTIVSNSKISPKETVDLRGIGVVGTGPHISTNFPTNKIIFDKTKPQGKNIKTLLIYNKGTENLLITNAKITPAGTPIYLDGFKIPNLIKPNDSLVQPLRFAPTVEKVVYDAILTITSNAVDMSSLVINLSAVSDIAGSVSESISEDRSIQINITPNPIQNNATLDVFSTKELPSDFVFNLYDIKGNFIKQIFSGSVLPGNNQISIKTDELLNGFYVISGKSKNISVGLHFIKN